MRLKVQYFALLMLVPALTLIHAAAEGPAPAKTPMVRSEPARIVNGSACLFVVHQPSTLQSLTGTWMEHQVFFSFDPARRAWVGLAGVAVESHPGSYPLVLKGLTAKGEPLNLGAQIVVGHVAYPSIALRIPEKFTAPPDPATAARIEHEQEIKNKAFATIGPERLWSGNFSEPVASTPSDGFGIQRKFNGVLKSTHHGLDFHAPMGTPIAAIGDGRVLLAGDFFYEGGLVVIDHGQGLSTLYMHLSETRVHEGDMVRRGQIIALSGSSGRATGPHLHLGVRWQGLYFDPRTLFKLRMPQK